MSVLNILTSVINFARSKFKLIKNKEVNVKCYKNQNEIVVNHEIILHLLIQNYSVR